MYVKPVCVKCKCFYRPHKNGFAFTEGMPNGNDPNDRFDNIRGLRKPSAWQPYKCWMGDLWKCPDCQHEIVVGVCSGPFAEHYQKDFEEIQTRLNAKQLQVNDC